MTRLPGKCSLASAYPSIEQKIRLPTVMIVATTVLLKKYVGKSSSVNSVR